MIQQRRMMTTFRQFQGFTLIELVVALAIFAVLSLAAWQVFDGLMKTRDRATIQAEHLMQWQAAYEQLLRDTAHVVARPVRTASDMQAALLIDGATLTLSRAGGQDVHGTGARDIQRIRYEVVDNTLWRLVYTTPDQVNEKPLKMMLMRGVSAFNVKALTPDAAGNWPDSINSGMLSGPLGGQSTITYAQLDALSTLPKGVEVTLTAYQRDMTWRFVLVGTAVGSGGTGAAAGAATHGNNANNSTSGSTGNAVPIRVFS